MPELAEVEYYWRRWDSGLGRKITGVSVHPGARIFRRTDSEVIVQRLTGTVLATSQAHGKQMLFGFSGGIWLSLHLGMTGELSSGPRNFQDRKHHHLVLRQSAGSLIFADYRQFGEVRLDEGSDTPVWWRELPPLLTSPGFTREMLAAYLTRRAKTPVKSALLHQERFPGIGNWMADEILWRARIRPQCVCGRIKGRKLSDLLSAVISVCRDALAVIADTGEDPPSDWLFSHRWADGGHCPKTGKRLLRSTIGGRTTCWSPTWQRWPRDVC